MLEAEGGACGYGSSLEPSPMPSQHNTRPPSASRRPNSAASSCGAPRSVPSITPLDGGGGPAGLSTDFHLGVVGASNGGGGSGGITGVSWQ